MKKAILIIAGVLIMIFSSCIKEEFNIDKIAKEPADSTETNP